MSETPCTTTLTANFTGTPTAVMPGGTVNFTDASTGTPTSWLWTFPGGTPGTSTLENPSIVYNTVGTYDVTLEVSDGSTTHSVTKTAYITVSSEPVYCDAGATGNYEYINAVSFGTINSTATGLGTGGYQDHTAMSTSVDPGSSYPITITLGSGYAQDKGRVWIDWNQNGQFTDAGEMVYESAAGVGPYSGNITVPGGATAGDTRMRIRIWDTSSAGANDTPCGDADWGEVEDYTVIVTGAAVPPVASFSASTTQVCAGGSVTFTDNSTNSPTSWSWNFNGGATNSTVQNPTVVFNTPGTYTVALTATNGSGSNTSTMTNYITVNANPTVTMSSDIGTATANVSGGEAPYTYLWNNGGNTATITGLTEGTYSVTVTDNNGCTQTGSIFVSGVGISEVDNNQIAVYPNPTNGLINIDSNGTIITRIMINDQLGRLIYDSKTNEEIEVIDLSGKSKGIYLMNIQTDGKTIVRKIVIQ